MARIKTPFSNVCLCEQSLEWSHPSLSGRSPFPRSGHAACVVGQASIAVFGGKKNQDTFSNEVSAV
jgi:hypothetical protein